MVEKERVYEIYTKYRYFSKTRLLNGRLPWGLSGKEMQEKWVQLLGQEDPLKWDPVFFPVFLPGKSHGQRLMGSQKSQTQHSN